MNILIIITPFSPAQDPNTIRWTELATHFKNQGHTIHVLTTKRKAYKDFTTQNGIFIHRTGYHTLLDWLYNIIGQKNRRHEPGYTAPNPFYRSRFIQKIVDYFWRRNYWPDGQVLFLKPGIKKGKQLVESQSIDQIISVGAPFTSHWIAHALKTNYAQLKWHMDIQDPFSYAKASQINNNRKYDQRNMASEASCFDKATTISVPFEKSAERYRHFFSRHHS
ncbi:MAG: hypothetical protein HKN09_13340 [Saprospiraceae bacterium]|nr:hypothetical protein [Saprospiraceae bacterium]